MDQRALILAPYALTSDYRERLRRVVDGEPRVLTAGDLRRSSAIELLRTLRRDRPDRVLIVLPDAASRPLVPVFGSLAVLTGASCIELVDHELRLTKLSRSEVIQAVAGSARASLGSVISLAKGRRTIKSLLEADHQRVTFDRGRGVLYLNAPLWLGVAAGGSIAHVVGVVNALHDEGLQVSYASFSDPPSLRPGVELLPLESPSSLGLSTELNHVRLQNKIVRDLLHAVQEDSPGVLYQRLSLSSFAGPIVARSLQVPYVLEYNGSEIWAARNWGRPLRHEAFATASEDASLRHAHLVVTVSDVLQDELRARGVEEERIVAHPNGVDPTVFSPDSATSARDELGLPADSFVVGFIGTFGEWHGAEVLAEAARRLIQTSPRWFTERDVRFMLVGDGRRMPAVRQILGALGGDVVKLPGLVPQERAPAFLAAADVLVSPHVENHDGSRFFGSPTKLFEYMAMAKPIIASDLEQLHDVLSPAVTAVNLPTGDPPGSRPEVAVLTRPGDVEELIDAIEFISDSAAWRELLGRNARAKVLAHYTWQHHVQEILAGLARVTGG